MFDKPSEPVKKSWGVRRENLSQSQLQRTNNPTEEKIAKEIRELKEREDELLRAREKKERPDSSEEEHEEEEKKAEEEEEEEEYPSSPSVSMESEPGVGVPAQPQPQPQPQQARLADKSRR